VRPGLDKLGSHLLQKKQKYYIWQGQKGTWRQIIINRETTKPSNTFELLGKYSTRKCDERSMFSEQLNKYQGQYHAWKDTSPWTDETTSSSVCDANSGLRFCSLHNPLKGKLHPRNLGVIQRIALIRVLSAFETTSTPALEWKSHMLPIRLRLKTRCPDHNTRICTYRKPPLVW
jgi:hypothetical protein